jgi:hypothetical protein
MKKAVFLTIGLFLGNLDLFGCGCHDAGMEKAQVDSVKAAIKSADNAAVLVMTVLNKFLIVGVAEAYEDRSVYDKILLQTKESNVRLSSIVFEAKKQKEILGK